MTGPEIRGQAGPSFSTATARDGDHITIRFFGNADLGAGDALELLLPRVHAEALRAGARVVTVDFTALEFMSSSCFRSFVSWVSDVQELPPEQQYRIVMRSNASMLWQRRSLHALKCFANELIDIET